MNPSRRIPKRKKDLTSPLPVTKTSSDEVSLEENSGGSSIRPSFLPPIAEKKSANNTAAIIQSCIPPRYLPPTLVEEKQEQPILRPNPTARQTAIMAENRLRRGTSSNTLSKPASTNNHFSEFKSNKIPRRLPSLYGSPSKLKQDPKEKNKESTKPNVSSVNFMG